MRLHLHIGSHQFDAGGFEERQHPRAKGGAKGGQFVKKGEEGAGSTPEARKMPARAPTEPAETSKRLPAPEASAEALPQLQPSSERAWTGAGNAQATRLSKQAAGALGEHIAAAYLRSIGLKDAKPLNTGRANYAVDLVGDDQVFEVKTGQVSSVRGAAQWRATIGEPGKAEKAWLATASEEEKAAHNEAKRKAIMERKQKAVAEVTRELGRPLAMKTFAVILDPDRGIADLFSFDGFHHRIGYNSEQAKNGYIGSYNYRAARSLDRNRSGIGRLRAELRRAAA